MYVLCNIISGFCLCFCVCALFVFFSLAGVLGLVVEVGPPTTPVTRSFSVKHILNYARKYAVIGLRARGALYCGVMFAVFP